MGPEAIAMSQMALPPARDTNVDHHQHIHNHHIHSHPHNNGHHSHSSSNSTLATPDHALQHNHRHVHHAHHHARSPSQHSLPNNNRPRANSDTVVVIETVSVIQLIDASGSTIALSTLPPSPPRTTTLIGTDFQLPTASGVAPELPALPSGVEVSLSLGVPTGPGNGVDTTLSLPPLDPTESPLESSMPTTFPTLSYSPLTSTPLSGGPIFPTFSGVTNSTTQATTTTPPLIAVNGTVSYSAFTTLSPDASSSADLTSSTLAAISSLESDATSTARPSTSSFITGTTTSSNGVAVPTWAGISDDGNAGPVATPQSSDQSSTTPPATIAGSVIGSIAGLAMLLILVLALLRYKRRKMEQSLESGATAKALTAGPAGTGGGYGAMSERPRSAPFAVPGALAALTGMRRSRQSATPPSTPGTGERGFSKVSGRKLPPVIQFGGDGYTDPRGTMMTDASSGGVSYRDSTGIFANPNQRFAVGTPMRPESGIPVFHGGPSRSPRIDEGPFSDAGPYVRTDSPTLIPPNMDPLGRSHAGISQDGSNRSTLSTSRFTENL